MNKKHIAILGSTGSIGTQALDVVRVFPEFLEVVVLACKANAALLIEQAIEFKPDKVVILDNQHYAVVKESLKNYPIEVLQGEEALVEVVELPEIDVVLNAIVGAAGLRPTVNAIRHHKDIALANKETLVVAGELIMNLVKQYQVKMLPVDSEHSAIFQCLAGEDYNPIEKLYLTASGGPFRGKDRGFLKSITKEQALKHPNWAMGAKITIDSASLMNKGLEVIEAKWLFDVDVKNIEVVVHPQSVIHSMIQFQDGSIKAQLGIPDMKLPIQYALTYPSRLQNNFERFDFVNYPNLTFEKPDLETFRNLDLAYTALEKGGNQSCVLNAANEIAVAAFLNNELSFLAMSDLIEETICQVEFQNNLTLSDCLAFDLESRRVAQDLVHKVSKKKL